MAYPDHQLLQISGIFSSGTEGYEVWSTGLRFIGFLGSEAGGSAPVTATVEELEAFLAANETELTDGLESADFNIAGASVRVQSLKFNALGADGRYIYDQTVSLEVPDEPWGVGTNPIVYPTQVSKVLTLETGFTRGVAARGRMYLPGPTNALNATNGTLTITQGEVDAWADFVGGLETTVTVGGRTVTFAPAVVSGIGTGFGWRLVEAVSMDNRPDIQRRRANDISGTRLRADLA